MEIESNLPLMKSLPVYVFSLIKERMGWLLLKSSMRCFLLTQSLQSKADICVLILWVYVTPSFWRSLYKIDKALLQQELIKQYHSLQELQCPYLRDTLCGPIVYMNLKNRSCPYGWMCPSELCTLRTITLASLHNELAGLWPSGVQPGP